MSRQSKIIFSILTGLIILGFVAYVYLANKGAQPIQPYLVEDSASKTKESKIISQSSLPTADTTTWTTYKGLHADEEFEFKYPSDILKLDAKDDAITLRHSTPLRHVNPCDERDNPTTLDNLTDVDITMQFLQGNLGDAISKNEPPEFLSEYFYYSDPGYQDLRLIPGFIDFIDIGSLHGYRITSGIEGCGVYTYYFPGLQTGRILIVKRTYGELTSLGTESQKYRTLPGVILPDEEEKIVHGILSTFKERGSAGPARRIPEFEAALNAHNGATIASLLTDRVWYILEATECCGWTKREQIVSKMSKGKGTLNFSEEQPLLQAIREKRSDLKNYTIGIGERTSNQDAAGYPRSPIWVFTAYHASEEGKIDRIRIGLYP